MKIFSQPLFVFLFFVNDSKQLVPLLSGTEMVGSSTRGLGHYGYSEPRNFSPPWGLLLNSGRQAAFLLIGLKVQFYRFFSQFIPAAASREPLNAQRAAESFGEVLD